MTFDLDIFRSAMLLVNSTARTRRSTQPLRRMSFLRRDRAALH